MFTFSKCPEIIKKLQDCWPVRFWRTKNLILIFFLLFFNKFFFKYLHKIGNDERHLQLHSGMVLSECIAQRNEHDRIRKEFQDLEERRHAALIQREFDLDRELTEKQKIKDENRKQYLKNIQSFQFIQADKRRKDEKEAKFSSDKSRRSVGTV